MASARSLISFDWAMKRLLRQKANFVILEGFLSELLRQDIKIKSMGESESNSEDEKDKFNRVDILAYTDSDEIILVELQVSFEADYFQRMLYGTSKTLIEHIKISQKYKSIKKIYSVSIVYFDLGQGKDYVYHGATNFYGLHDQTDKLELSEKQKKHLPQSAIQDIYPEYYVLKVNTFDDLAKDNLDEWIYFLKNNEILDGFHAKGLNEAKEIMQTYKMDEQERQKYKIHIENLRYEMSMLDTAKVEGILEGKIDEKRETTFRCFEMGLNNDMVVKLTGLKFEEVEAIRKEWDKQK
ncbi:MAG: Rpn family recombination-promoting nuclease/putative transposase, partial [Bacteroidota bacterium]